MQAENKKKYNFAEPPENAGPEKRVSPACLPKTKAADLSSGRR